MTQDDLDKKAAAQVRSLRAWSARVAAVVAGKVADARAHAGNAVTGVLRDTPDGRATIRRAAANPSYRAALSRLDELWTLLCGPSAASLDGLLRDARAAAYAESFEAWKPFIPDSLWVAPDPAPTVAGTNAARAMVLHGTELRKELGAPIMRAKHTLAAAIALAGRRGSPERTASDLLDNWARAALAAIDRAAAVALSDGQVAADVLAGRDLVHDDYLDHTPLAVGQ